MAWHDDDSPRLKEGPALWRDEEQLVSQHLRLAEHEPFMRALEDAAEALERRWLAAELVPRSWWWARRPDWVYSIYSSIAARSARRWGNEWKIPIPEKTLVPTVYLAVRARVHWICVDWGLSAGCGGCLGFLASQVPRLRRRREGALWAQGAGHLWRVGSRYRVGEAFDFVHWSHADEHTGREVTVLGLGGLEVSEEPSIAGSQMWWCGDSRGEFELSGRRFGLSEWLGWSPVDRNRVFGEGGIRQSFPRAPSPEPRAAESARHHGR